MVWPFSFYRSHTYPIAHLLVQYLLDCNSEPFGLESRQKKTEWQSYPKFIQPIIQIFSRGRGSPLGTLSRYSSPIDTPYWLAWLTHRRRNADAYLANTNKDWQVQLSNESNRGGQGVAENEVTHGKGIVATGSYAILGEIIFQKIVVLLMMEQGGVLLDGDVKGNILVRVPFGVEKQRYTALACSYHRSNSVGERVSLNPPVMTDGDKTKMPRIGHTTA